MYRTVIGLLTLAVAVFAADVRTAPRQGRALTIEDYYRVPTVGGTQISPDGRWVMFTVAHRLEIDNGTRTETNVVSADGAGQPRHLTHEGRELTNTRWSDDSWIEYSAGADRFKLDPSRPAEPVKIAPGGTASAPQGRGGRGGAAVRSPDGRWLAQMREVPRPRVEPKYGSDFEKRHQERFKGAIFDWKDFQRDGEAFPAPDPTARPAQHLVLRPAEGGTEKALVERDIRPAGVVWHPDGKVLAFTADPKWRDPLLYSRSDIFTVTVDGAITQLTDDGYNYSDVDFSPDGRWMSYARTFGTDMVIRQKLNHGGPRDLFVRAAGPALSEPSESKGPALSGRSEPKGVNLTASWDLEPGDSRWSPDSRHLYFTATTGGEVHLFRVGVEGSGRVEQLTTGPRRIAGLTYDRAMRRIAYTATTHEAPADVYVADVDGKNERRLTNLHTALTTEIAFSRAERLTWKSYDGTPIEGWLMYPHGYEASKGPYPLIVTSHGGPHSATGYTFDFKDQYFAANGYFVFDTNFRSSTGYGEKFKWATWGAWGDKDGEDVMSGIDFVLKRYPIDAKRVGHTGHSYGGFMTNWLITQYPDRFAAAISGAGISNWISDYGTADIYRTKETEFFGTPWEKEARDRMIRQSPLTYAGRVKTPTLFVHGEVDQRVPYEEAEQLYFALRRRGVPAKVIQYAGQAHGISGHWNNVHRMLNELAWWEQYLKPRGTGTRRP